MAAVTSAVLTTVAPFGVLGDTRTTTVKFAETPEASVAIVPLIVPVPPAAGLGQIECRSRRLRIRDERRVGWHDVRTAPRSGRRWGRCSRP